LQAAALIEKQRQNVIVSWVPDLLAVLDESNEFRRLVAMAGGQNGTQSIHIHTGPVLA
jgi:hypothetical protein